MLLTIFGNGVMANAMIAGLLEHGFNIEVFGRDEKKLQTLSERFRSQVIVSVYEKGVDISGKNVILCVKPYALDEVAQYIKGRASTLFSVLAGTTIEKLQESVKAAHYVRAMPNIAAMFGKSTTTLTGDKESKEKALKIFGAIGKTLWVGSEKELDTATILAGSAPAFLALVAESLIDGGVKEGLKREDASFLAQGLFESFSALLDNYSHPSLIKDAVMSPNGITAKGYAVLEDYKVRSAFIKVYKGI
ncbi:MAG: pyrroline-5-carboxylate reductase [Campylobacteraceae bacterium]|jgi:pyrroline-5-carboxylate reductase|nr:pyrroline-5-carboxylate reductase [Campylobacteraceae bacterium]